MAKRLKEIDRLGRFFFWIFFIMAVLAVFLFWSVRHIGEEETTVNNATTFLAGIIASLLSVFFGLLCFRRFLHRRSIAGGLFLTTSIATVVFLVTSQFIHILIPPGATVFARDTEATAVGESFVVMFAQVGLFGIWFAILLFAIYTQVRPVKRIERYLERISDGERLKTIKIGKSRQYKSLEEKLSRISDQVYLFQNRKVGSSKVVKLNNPAESVDKSRV